MVFWALITGLPVLGLMWCAWAFFKAGVLPRAWMWRLGVAAFAGVNVGGFLWLIVARRSDYSDYPPLLIVMGASIWHLFVLPITVVMTVGIAAPLWLRARVRRGAKVVAGAAVANPVASKEPENDTALMSRRQFLVASAVAGPPLMTGVAIIRGAQQIDNFRIREIDVPLATLPKGLDGMTIAHITDTHVGRYTSPALLAAVVERTNKLRCDMVAFTGDLIDFSLKDLPLALDMLKSFDAEMGVWLCEGNHDLFASREAYYRGCVDAGVNLLVDHSRVLRYRGMPFNVMGMGWGSDADRRNPRLSEHFAKTDARRERGLFSIMLAHHPHSFELAAPAGVELTLAGHTHGGQWMLTEGLGAGPLAYRYWSGLYQRALGGPGNATVGGGAMAASVVSNGVGNWFPLRINAPAEIVKITLRRV